MRLDHKKHHKIVEKLKYLSKILCLGKTLVYVWVTLVYVWVTTIKISGSKYFRDREHTLQTNYVYRIWNRKRWSQTQHKDILISNIYIM